MICFVFPGQPLSCADKPQDSLLDYLSGRCSALTGFDPWSTPRSSSAMTEAVRLQLTGTILSLHTFLHCVQQGQVPNLVAEHSMGIYPALAACRSINSDESLELTFRIGQCLATMGKDGHYCLGSVAGLSRGRLEVIAGAAGVHIASHNTSRHFLLSGERERMAQAMLQAETAGAFATAIFPCDAPLHTPLIGQIARELQAIIDEYRFRQPEIPLMDHMEQRLLSAEDIPVFLLEQLCRPVYWERTYLALRRIGATSFTEMGLAGPLHKFNRWIDSDYEIS